jgi:hypothetical protein
MTDDGSVNASPLANYETVRSKHLRGRHRRTWKRITYVVHLKRTKLNGTHQERIKNAARITHHDTCLNTG